MQTAITVFIPHGKPLEILHGPETLEAAKERLHIAMRSGHHDPGCVEIWTAKGVTDRFVFKSRSEDNLPTDKDSVTDKSSVARS